jgi:hypothetical protein
MSQIDQPEILLAQPRGFCAGVDRAINIVNEALSRFGKPIYVVGLWYSVPTAFRKKSGAMPKRAACRYTMQLAHWSPKCIWK